MTISPLLSVIVPVYNEVYTVSESLNRILNVIQSNRFTYELIVIESNSNDGTRQVLLDRNDINRLILQEKPCGKGNAVRAGLDEAQGDIIVIYDGDLEYNADDLPKLLQPIISNQGKFVLGSRHSESGPMRTMENSRIKVNIMNLAHKFFCFLINFGFKVKLQDPFTMWKIFRRNIFEDIELIGNRFDFDWELVCKSIRLGVVPIEIPVQYSSRDFAHGKKIRFFRDPISWLLMFIKCLFLPLK